MRRNPCLALVLGMVAVVLAMSFGTSPAAPEPAGPGSSSSVSAVVTPSREPRLERSACNGGAQIGDHRAYRFVLKQSGTVGGGAGGESPETFAATVRGMLHTTLCAMTDRGFEYEVVVRELVADQGGSARVVAPPGAPLRVLQGRNGLVAGYHVEPGTDARLPRLLFLRIHQAPVDATDRIRAEDETGLCDFRFEQDASGSAQRVVTRTKERIVPIRVSEVPTVITIEESLDRIEQVQGLTMHAVCREVLAIDAGGIAVMASFDLEAECVEQSRVAVAARGPTEFGPWQMTGSAASERVPPTLDAVLEGLRGLEAQGELGTIAMQRLFAGLIERLASDPAAVEDLVRRLLAGEAAPPHLTLDLTGLLVSALADAAAAGGTHAVAAMEQLVRQLPAGDVLAALGRSLHQLGALAPGQVQPVLAATTARLRFLGPGEDPAGDLALAVGGLIRAAGPACAEAASALAVLRERAAGDGHPGRFVTALAESRDADLIRTEVLPLAAHGDAGVRLRVMEALAVCVHDADAQRILVRAAAQDPDPGVRIAAAGSLAGVATPAASSALSRMATEDADASVRIAALQHLANIRDAAAIAVLERASRQDPDVEVRRLAGEWLRGM